MRQKAHEDGSGEVGLGDFVVVVGVHAAEGLRHTLTLCQGMQRQRFERL